jgi:hypothetical protein
VSAYLKALLGTPLERRVLMLLDNPLASDFPTTIEEAVATMTGAWRTEVTRGALKPSVSTNDEPAMLSAAASHGVRKCIVCNMNNQTTDDCRKLAKAIQSGALGKQDHKTSSRKTTKKEKKSGSSGRSQNTTSNNDRNSPGGNNANQNKSSVAISDRNMALTSRGRQRNSESSGVVTLTMDSGSNVNVFV